MQPMSIMNGRITDFAVSDYANLAAPDSSVPLWGGGMNEIEPSGEGHSVPGHHQPPNLGRNYDAASPLAHLPPLHQYISPQSSPYPQSSPFQNGYPADNLLPLPQVPTNYPLPSLPPTAQFQTSRTSERDITRYFQSELNRTLHAQPLAPAGSASPAAVSPHVHANTHPEAHTEGGYLQVPLFSHRQTRAQPSHDSGCRRQLLKITTTLNSDHLNSQYAARPSPGLPSTTTNSPLSSLLPTPPAPWADPPGSFSADPVRFTNSAQTQSSRSHPTIHTFSHQQQPQPPLLPFPPVHQSHQYYSPEYPFAHFSQPQIYNPMDTTKEDPSSIAVNNSMDVSSGESLKTHTPPHILPAAVVASPARIEHALHQESQQGLPQPSHPSIANLPPNVPVPPPVSVIATGPLSAGVVTPNFNNSPHLSGYRTTIRSTDLTPVNAPPKARSYKIKSATSHKDAVPATPLSSPGAVAPPGLRKRTADEAELSEMDTDSHGTPADTVLIPVLVAGQLGQSKTAEEIKREKNRESQRRSRQRKHQTLENYQADIERLMREKEEVRHQLSRERDEWKDRALKAEARLPLIPQPTDPTPSAPAA